MAASSSLAKPRSRWGHSDGRGAIGIDLEERYCAIAAERLTEANEEGEAA
jgi:hypothetical protein